MAVSIRTKKIKRVAVIDDNREARESMADSLLSAHFNPRPLPGPFNNASDIVACAMKRADAAVCDHHLIVENFAKCTGAEVVAGFYRRKFPAVLVTAWWAPDIDEIQFYRRWVPTLLKPPADPDEIEKGFFRCMEEHEQKFRPPRRPWRTLIRIEEVRGRTDNSPVCAVIPGWNPSEVVRFPLRIIPKGLRRHVKPGARFFAQVNKGAHDQADLYFEGFEYRE
jgi:hypothetical protein